MHEALDSIPQPHIPSQKKVRKKEREKVLPN
jgi:hypothetical protein